MEVGIWNGGGVGTWNAKSETVGNLKCVSVKFGIWNWGSGRTGDGVSRLPDGRADLRLNSTDTPAFVEQEFGI